MRLLLYLCKVLKNKIPSCANCQMVNNYENNKDSQLKSLIITKEL